MSDLTGRRALVTGSSQGLGRVIAMELAKHGCEVIVNCAGHLEKAEQVVQEIRREGGRAEAFRCDITDETAVKALFAKFTPLDILVNNARLDPYFRKEGCSDADWFRKVLDVNVVGAYNCAMAFLEQARERRYGRIVNISSVRSFLPAEMNMIAYNTSKCAMHALTRAFAQNGAPYGITCNTVAPGVIATENFAKRISPEKQRQELSAVPLGRGATCEEVADAVIFAITNGYITGDTINVNGGMYYEP